jgi:hypothetical protein
MSRRTTGFLSATFVLLIASSVTGRQQATPRQPSPPAETTITGCLKSGPNPSGVPEPVTYTLEPIETTAAPPSAAATAADVKPSSTKRYTLTSSRTIEFSSHVGHKVEITGHLKDLGNPERTSPGDVQKKPPAQGGAHNTFEVAALKLLATKCP